MTNSYYDWANEEQDHPFDSSLVDANELVDDDLIDQRRAEIREILRIMEYRLASGKHEPSVDPEFFNRKKELESELDDLYF